MTLPVSRPTLQCPRQKNGLAPVWVPPGIPGFPPPWPVLALLAVADPAALAVRAVDGASVVRESRATTHAGARHMRVGVGNGRVEGPAVAEVTCAPGGGRGGGGSKRRRGEGGEGGESNEGGAGGNGDRLSIWGRAGSLPHTRDHRGFDAFFPRPCRRLREQGRAGP
jgi:hypothetical protein